MKKVLIISLSATMVCGVGSSAYASTPALPNGTITTQDGIRFLMDSKGEKYSGWFIDSKEDWYYFNESDKTMKTGWHHDDKDGYWYYLNLSDGKMVTGWQTIEGKEYFFQPVRDMGNYHFNNEQEKWLYSVNSKVPYGAMYVNTTTPDGIKVDSTGAKVIPETATQTVNNNSSSNTEIVKNGWISENGSWHYYESGTLAKNKWLNLDGKWYYVLADGAMVSNTWKEIGGKSYYFGGDGAMYVNATTPDGKKVNSSGEIIKTNAYSSYIGEYSDLEDFQNQYFEVSMGYVQFLTINSVEDNKIYGNYEGGYHDIKTENFENGIPIINNQFTVEGVIEGGTGWGEQETGTKSMYTATYTLSKEKGNPIIIKDDGTIFYIINGSPKYN